MKNLLSAIFAVSMMSLLVSCNKYKPDTIPANGVDPNITVNFSVDSLKALCAKNNGNPVQITQNLVIAGVVVADDSSGTFYKEVDIQDSTGAILLGIDGSYLYNQYPMGTRLFVNLKGLYVVNNKGSYEIVAILNPGGTYTGIPSSVTSQYITPGKWGLYVAPKVATVAQLNDSAVAWQNELVQLNNVQFTSNQLNVPYVTLNVNLRDCGGENLIQVYTSSYADFANNLTPSGNGTFTGIISVYNTSPELLIRTPSDLNMTGPLCP